MLPQPDVPGSLGPRAAAVTLGRACCESALYVGFQVKSDTVSERKCTYFRLKPVSGLQECCIHGNQVISVRFDRFDSFDSFRRPGEPLLSVKVRYTRDFK